MINRYQTNAMAKIWNEEEKLNLWLEFELFVCQALVSLKIMPKKDLTLILAKAKINLPLMKKLEIETQHDVVSFTRMLSANLGYESRWIHYGITSTDMVDSVLNYQIKQANKIINERIKQLQETLKKLALNYEKQLVMGRTHGIFAEPTSLGLKFALWFEELNRQKKRIQLAKTQIEVVKVTGAVGNYAHVSPFISKYIAKKWKMGIDNSATQVCQRDRHAFLINSYANLASTIEKIALEIRSSQRTEVNELMEGFSSKQKGSSAMPHKKNPVGCENIMGLSRLIRNFGATAYENNLLWYERDISHSSNERIIIPDLFHLLDFTCQRMNQILSDLVINTDAMVNNIKKANELYFSQAVLLAIIKNNSNITREFAYDYIQNITNITADTKQNFKKVLLQNNVKQFLTNEQLNQCFDNEQFLHETNYIYQKIFNESN